MMKRALFRILALILALGMALPLGTPALAATSTNITTISVTDLTPDTAAQGDLKIPILEFTVKSSQSGGDELKKVKVTYTGSALQDIAAMYLYSENATSGGTFDPTEDTAIASVTAPDKLIKKTIDLDPNPDFSMAENVTYQFYIVVDLQSMIPDYHDCVAPKIDAKIDKEKIEFDSGKWPPDPDIISWDPSGETQIQNTSPWPLSRFRPTKDSWVDEKAGKQDENYGSDHKLHARWQVSGEERRTYLQFDLSCLPECTVIDSAILHVYRNKDTGVPSAYNTSDNWTEGGIGNITWNNQPGPGALVVNGTGTASPEKQWLTWNITSYAASEYAGDKTVSVVLKYTSGPVDDDAHHSDLTSREGNLGEQPWLEIAYSTAQYNLAVTSDGCCPIQVAYNSSAANVSANISAGGSQNFTDIPCCTNVTLIADDSDLCCEFLEWVVDDMPLKSGNNITVHMGANHTAVATCRGLSFNLTTNVNPPEGGTVSGGGTYNCCTNVTVNATPKDCWYFTGWSGDLGGTDNPTSFHIDGNKNITANFARYSYNLTTNANPPEGGTVSGGGTYNCCTNVTVNATPADSCWYFTGWSGDLAGTDNPTSIHIDGNKNVTANFARYSYNLTVSSDGCCPIDVSWDSSSANVSANASANFTIPCCTNVTLYADDSDPFCDFVEWVVDDASQGAGVNNITVNMGANHTAVAICSEVVCCSIGDVLFYDNNGNGVHDPYEPGIPGVQVNLYRDDGNNLFNPSGGTDDLVASCMTDTFGKYKFTGLNCSATYWVYVVPGTLPPSLTLTTDSNPWGPITLDPEGEDYNLADFGYRPPIPVGGEAYPINKISVLAPWVGLVMFLVGPGALIVLRRKQAARRS